MKQFVLPALPYAVDALAPHLSKETLEYHYGKHHAAYITNLNQLTEGQDFRNMPVEAIIKSTTGGLFNNAAQAYNHTFYWYCMTPNTADTMPAPPSHLAAALEETFGSLDSFVKEFTDTGLKHFGSGWAWLLRTKDGRLQVKGMHDADTPVKDGDLPLLALDVWEHAYYIDYRNARATYIEAFWKVINWQFVEDQLLKTNDQSLLTAIDQ